VKILIKDCYYWNTFCCLWFICTSNKSVMSADPSVFFENDCPWLDFNKTSYKYSHCTCWWLDTGFGLVIGFTEILQLVTTSNYNAFANLHILQITATHAKSSQFTVSSCTHCLVVAFDNADPLYCFRAQQLLFLLAGDWLASNQWLCLLSPVFTHPSPHNRPCNHVTVNQNMYSDCIMLSPQWISGFVPFDIQINILGICENDFFSLREEFAKISRIETRMRIFSNRTVFFSL
jgi:hypothetical protein